MDFFLLCFEFFELLFSKTKIEIVTFYRNWTRWKPPPLKAITCASCVAKLFDQELRSSDSRTELTAGSFCLGESITAESRITEGLPTFFFFKTRYKRPGKLRP